MAQRQRIENVIDRGELHVTKREFCRLHFFGCGLSMADKRSRFNYCSFRDIQTEKCVAGFPVFYRCQFHDIVAKDGLNLLYGSVFIECTVSGNVRNMNIGLSVGDLGFPSVDDRKAAQLGYPSRDVREKIKAENLALVSQSDYSLDFRNADLDEVSFMGEEIVPFLRFRKGQAIIWKGANLREKLVELSRTTANRNWSDFLLAYAPPEPSDRIAVTIIPATVQNSLGALEKALSRVGIGVQHFD